MSKIFVFDSGFFTHKSIFAYAAALKMKQEGKIEMVMGSAYNYFNMMCATLKKLGATKEDIIIVAKDGRSSWRKAFLQAYKGQRQANRDKATLFNWNEEYKKISELEHQLHISTNWHFIGLNYYYNFADLILTDEGRALNIQSYDIEYDKEFSIESDDIQAVCCKRFPNNEVILVTIDEDLDQLCYFHNVKIFNPNLTGFKKVKNKEDPKAEPEIKKTGVKGFYKIVEEPLEILNKKIRLGDVSDNIRQDNSTPEIRKVVIDLINLPKFVVDPINDILSYIEPKQINYERLPFSNSLGRKFDSVYEPSSNIVTMEKSIKAHQLRVQKKKQQTQASYERQKAKKAKTKKEALR